MALTVFYLDDEPDLVEIFALSFSNEKINVKGFTDSQGILDALSHSKPDVIFIDFRMPSISGDLLAEKMPADIPKYLLTGELDAQPNYPFNAILGKPYDHKEIQVILDELLKKAG